MLKRLISIIIIIVMIFIFTSCNKTNDENATIQIWCYDFEGAGGYSDTLDSILANSKIFCEKNKIPLEIVRYDEKTLSHEDYVLKRNAAAANGNMIIIEDARYLSDISKQHADYSKLNNYDSLLSSYKDRYCIPLGVGYRAVAVNNDVLNYYGINTEKPIITYGEYLEIKQQMKESGAKIKVTPTEYEEILDYYLDKNGLKFVNEDSAVLKDNDKFKESLKNTIVGMCDDFILFNDSLLNVDSVQNYSKNNSFIYDENSELMLYDNTDNTYFITGYSDFVNLGESILNKTLVISPKSTFMSPCFYMYKEITNNKIYDLANYIVSETSYLYVSNRFHYFSPVFDAERTKKLLDVDDNWKYIGEFKTRAEQGKEVDMKIYNLVNDVYEMLVKNKETSKLIASYYYINRGYSNRIYGFVADSIYELSNQKFDYKNEEISKMIDNRINEFITNFNVYYN